MSIASREVILRFLRVLTGLMASVLAALTSHGLSAQEPDGTATDAASGAAFSSGFPGNPIVEIFIALLGILALICIIAWLVKRFSGLSPQNSRLLKTVAVMPLGSRERIAVIQVGERQIVVGITPTQITSLLELDKSLELPPSGGEFARKLQSLMHRDQNGAKGEANGVQKQP